MWAFFNSSHLYSYFFRSKCGFWGGKISLCLPIRSKFEFVRTKVRYSIKRPFYKAPINAWNHQDLWTTLYTHIFCTCLSFFLNSCPHTTTAMHRVGFVLLLLLLLRLFGALSKQAPILHSSFFIALPIFTHRMQRGGRGFQRGGKDT